MTFTHFNKYRNKRSGKLKRLLADAQKAKLPLMEFAERAYMIGANDALEMIDDQTHKTSDEAGR